MAIEYTLSILKPDAVLRNLSGKINAMIEGAGFEIAAQRMLELDPEEAAAFYQVHSQQPFYQSLVEYMSSGPIVVQVLKAE
ncbi:MAG: nucleoside-diphosphate kinase, partial [Rickettsiaceae bacterium]|nr:nucleoside-diphosphate kinase [Rickettsiaceae bacterium]